MRKFNLEVQHEGLPNGWGRDRFHSSACAFVKRMALQA